MKIEVNGNMATIYTPYNANFVSAIKKVGGAKWQSDKKAWAVPTAAVEAVREIMRNVYGEDDTPDASERITVRLTFEQGLSTWHGDVTLLGKCISHAYGRDSGATVGQDVAFIKGGPDSGGSVKNWTSIVEQGSVAILSNVPRSLYESTTLPEGVIAEIVEVVIPDREALIAERERLIKRIAEIDELLKK